MFNCFIVSLLRVGHALARQHVSLHLLKVQRLYEATYVVAGRPYTHVVPSSAHTQTRAIKCQWSRRVTQGNIAGQQSDEVRRNSH